MSIGEGMWHGFQASAARFSFPEGEAAFKQIGDFVDQLKGE